MRLPNLIIPNGATNGTEIDVADIDHLTIYGPAALTGAISIEVNPDGGSVWFPRVGVPAINILIDVPVINADQMRLVSAAVEGAERTFIVRGSTLAVV